MGDHLQHHLSTVLRDGQANATAQNIDLVTLSPFRGVLSLVSASPLWGLLDQG
ncbi:hypothetical protein VLK31_35715 [Variovorax sp. H27-G14]|uniref:hypothetical protein n=1 Tax=Variovorax sp. H27-G14 TaxID=3111914 RepID=UPI0038FD1D1C